MAPRVKVHADAEAPGQSVINAASTSVTVTDATGRAITVKRVSPFDRMRLFKAVGPVNSQNQQYLGFALLAASVTGFDGDSIPFPVSEREVEFTVQRLGEEGMAAVGAAHIEHFGIKVSDDQVEQAKN